MRNTICKFRAVRIFSNIYGNKKISANHMTEALKKAIMNKNRRYSVRINPTSFEILKPECPPDDYYISHKKEIYYEHNA